MASSYPGSLDSFNDPISTTYEDDAGYFHDVEHALANDAILAVQTELGTDPSGTSFTTVKGRLNDIDTRLGSSPLYVGNTAPASPQENWVWIDTTGL